MFKNKYLLAIFLVLTSALSALAQNGKDFEAAISSNLTSVSLPANANRVLPQSVPTEITQTLNKLASAGEGKLQAGDSEVLVWSGDQYKRVGKTTTLNRLTDTLKVAGWQYEVGGEEDGITVFSLLKDGANRRALIGFYGESEGTLILAWTELLKKDGGVSDADVAADNAVQSVEATDVKMTGSAPGGIIGKWDNGSVSTVIRQDPYSGSTSPGRSSRFEYTFTADGRFAFTGLAQTVNYSCTDTLFNEKAGRYTLNGSTLTLTPSKNFWRKTSSCSPSQNMEKNYTLTKETYQFSTKTDEYGKQLICLTNSNGESCYRRAQ